MAFGEKALFFGYFGEPFFRCAHFGASIAPFLEAGITDEEMVEQNEADTEGGADISTGPGCRAAAGAREKQLRGKGAASGAGLHFFQKRGGMVRRVF